MFSVLNAVLLKPLPYPSPEQLVMLWTESPSQNLREGRSAYWNAEQWRTQTKTFEDLAFYDPASVTLTTADKTERVSALRVTPNLLALLGVQPAYGRIFSPEEAEQREPVALIGNRFWRTRFGGATDAIGATIVVDGVDVKIVGVLPDASKLPQFNPDVLQPHTFVPDWPAARTARGAGAWFVLGRLKAEASLEQAQAEMNAIARRLDDEMPAAERGRGIAVVPLMRQLIGATTRLALWMLSGAVSLVLLIAVTNVAGLTLARSAGREREISIRVALGARQGRLVRQLLAESLTLAVLSGVFGVMVAVAATRWALLLRAGDVFRLDQTGVDSTVLAWTLAICVAMGILVGLTPALTVSNRKRITGGFIARPVRRVLVVTEFAVTIMLMAAAGLLIRSLWSVESVDPGFRAARVLSLQVATPAFGEAQRVDFYHRALQEIESLPDVESAGVIGDLFVGGSAERIVTARTDTTMVTDRVRLRRDEISPHFFRTIAAPLLKGRMFSSADGPDSRRVAIINDTMARRFWPGADPLGAIFKFGGPDSNNPWFTVVGVVADMRRQSLEIEPIPQMFEPLAQNPSRLATLLVRTSTHAPLKIAPSVEAAVHGIEKYAAVYGINTLDDRLGGFLAQRRFQSSLLAAFAGIALILSAIGIYGLMQYSVATRTREIGIRIAVGAQAAEIFRMVIGEGMRLGLAGLLIGLAAAFLAAQAASSLLFGVRPTDPLTFISVSMLLTAVAAAACYFPARRATKIGVIRALRQD